MQYRTTQEVPAQHWDDQQASVIEEMRRQVQHDLAAQNPGSDVVVEAVHYNVSDNTSRAASPSAPASYMVEFVFDYTVGGQTNAYNA
jgi:hypothetical protein